MTIGSIGSTSCERIEGVRAGPHRHHTHPHESAPRQLPTSCASGGALVPPITADTIEEAPDDSRRLYCLSTVKRLIEYPSAPPMTTSDKK
jgi:hypothetical protein